MLVPIDASSQSTKALQYALETFPDAEITVLHAIDPFETRYGDGQLVHTEEEYEQILKETKRLYTKATNLADEFGVEITTATAVEPVPRLPATAILSYVDEGKTDHVIMGSHGRSGVSRVLLGSVAETVARRSQVPVTIVR
ncbi:stress response protein [Halococcus hamelinensis 100A6]|uniref:Stress response protein n=1 Tax=Halococcus hamelinensis 100A6 TaxID=1132509 RepID=M0MBQ7_9EURY|nr:stress response protein [Halococcus hamelinensis 100A6]